MRRKYMMRAAEKRMNALLRDSEHAVQLKQNLEKEKLLRISDYKDDSLLYELLDKRDKSVVLCSRIVKKKKSEKKPVMEKLLGK